MAEGASVSSPSTAWLCRTHAITTPKRHYLYLVVPFQARQSWNQANRCNGPKHPPRAEMGQNLKSLGLLVNSNDKGSRSTRARQCTTRSTMWQPTGDGRDKAPTAARPSLHAHGTVTIFIMLVLPAHSSRVPCTATTTSPVFAMPISLALAKPFWITLSVPWKDAVPMGTTPRA